MAPPWSSRLRSNGNSNSNSPAPAGDRRNVDSKFITRPSPESLDPPTLHPERVMTNAPRTVSSGSREHNHNRSSSHPLPRLFARKKSIPQLNPADSDIALDDEHGPVLVVSPDPTSSGSSHIRVGKGDGDGKATRLCMCCDSKVKVPKELEKFRCMCCLTVNDLKPLEEQLEERKASSSSAPNNASHLDVGLNSERTPLTVERTKAIIDQCLISFLESRCMAHDDTSHNPSQRRPSKSPIPQLPDREHHTDEAGAFADLQVPSMQFLAPTSSIRSAGRGSTKGDRPRTSDSQSGADATHPRPRLSPIYDIPTLKPSPSMRQPSSLDSMNRRPSLLPAKPLRRAPGLPGTSAQSQGIPIRSRSPRRDDFASGHSLPDLHTAAPPIDKKVEQQRHREHAKNIFRPLEEYIIGSFGDFRCLNAAFSSMRPVANGRTRSESNIPTPPPKHIEEIPIFTDDALHGLDAKTLLLGDIGENGSWWTGKYDRHGDQKHSERKKSSHSNARAVSSKSPNIHWSSLEEWFYLVDSAGQNWQEKVHLVKVDDHARVQSHLEGEDNIKSIEHDLAEAREHAVRTLFKVMENLLKRPTRPLRKPEDLRFLLILLFNPLLYPSASKVRTPSGPTLGGVAATGLAHSPIESSKTQRKPDQLGPGRDGIQHTGLLKRIFGLLANSSDSCHRYLISWFCRFDEKPFVNVVDLVASFITHRISRRPSHARAKDGVDDGGLIPDLSGSAMNTSAQLHSALGLSGSSKKRGEDNDTEPDWASDWQVKATAKFMSLLFAASNTWHSVRSRHGPSRSVNTTSEGIQGARARRSGQLLHTSSFYNTLLDYHNMIADFKVWETKRDRFAFCQYPFFLSMGTKIKVLEFDARRQMEIKAREAYFDQIIRQRTLDGYFHLRVRRECMVDDSLRQISAAVGAGQEELKKSLRVHFTGEEGVDAGGLRKEWFLMLIRDIFDANHGMFVYDDESHACYFNPHSFETSDQYYLVGALLGLAIYNSTILDVALPPFAFRKLLAAAPSSITNNASMVSTLTGTKGQMTYTPSDLAEYKPSLAVGLQQLLDFDGDVEATYCRDFVATVDRYGVAVDVPLVPNGENIPVTNANRYEFVDTYVRYLLDACVARQFEPFKRGFFTVCAGNALSLFRAEEIELLIRGSDEALDIDALRAVAIYENWKSLDPPHAPILNPADSVPVLVWFWELFAEATPDRQRKLLSFITGTDRIPALGTTSLVLKLVAAGPGPATSTSNHASDHTRFPVARTCFNMLVLWPYQSRQQLHDKLWRAIEESEGFGLK